MKREKDCINKKVLIIYKYLPQYRVNFFQQLKRDLQDYHVELELIHGKSTKEHALRMDEGQISWAKVIKNRTLRVAGKSIIWQPCLRQLGNKDMIITLPENKLLLNYYLMIARRFSKYKFGFWGHTYNMRKDPKSLRNKGKVLFLNKCDWWFAYTKSSKKILTDRNFPKNKITVVQNAISTQELKEFYHKISDTDIKKLKMRLGISGSKIAIYCGSMYAGKDFNFILEACYRIKKEVPDFHMLFIGSGKESIKIKKAAEDANWIHYVGPKFGYERAIYFKISAVQLMPRLVGLSIVDSFVLETPIITTDNPFHGPEIDYLENGINGIITKDNIDCFSQTSITLIKNEEYLGLIAGCIASSEIYTITNMVNNFKEGILSCIYGNGSQYNQNKTLPIPESYHK